MHMKHFEDRRLEKLKILIEERESIIREGGPYSPARDGNRNNLSAKGSRLSAGPSAVMSQGKSKNQENMEKAQMATKLREIEQLMEQEMRQQEIKQRNDEKMAVQKMRDDMRRQDLYNKQKQKEQKKAMEE